ncbi:hypothetical protein [Streptomyces sp. DH41]|uniref:hypothetical protein n=1 Tax=Streptomyces sp. DH41 TaxID=3040125 RepID=UPI00244208AD|nr:hypothetical protein [Streptomyces sp. DH41]MDG9728686.1 hypothetical protein [Streptomyces sp. DH41]
MLMGTAERRKAPEDGGAAGSAAPSVPEEPDRDIATAEPDAPARERPERSKQSKQSKQSDQSDRREARERQSAYRPLWVEEPARRRRLPDPVRIAAVRAVLVVAVTLIMAMVAFLCTLAGSWLAFPMVIGSVTGTVVATWGVLDVWVTRQVWKQRHGVVSMPSSTARAMRRERRRARRQARSAERTRERIRRRGGAGQLSHS